MKAVRKGDLKLIASALGMHENSVAQVSMGSRKNDIICELIDLSKTDRVEFAKRLRDERESLDILMEAGLKKEPKGRKAQKMGVS